MTEKFFIEGVVLDKWMWCLLWALSWLTEKSASQRTESQPYLKWFSISLTALLNFLCCCSLGIQWMLISLIHVKKLIFVQELVINSLMAAECSAKAVSQERELGKAELCSEATSELCVLKESHEGHYTKPPATYSWFPIYCTERLF